jgi:hypothetical protein
MKSSKRGRDTQAKGINGNNALYQHDQSQINVTPRRLDDSDTHKVSLSEHPTKSKKT